MAHHKSALKRHRQSEKKRIYNRQNKKVMKLSLRSVHESKTGEEGQVNLVKAFSILDRLAAKGIIPKNKAANDKSKLNKFVKGLNTANA